eukprot:s383_g16.t1
MCRLHGSTSRGTVPPARAKASARPAQEPPLGEQEGEEGHQPRTVGEELEAAGHDQMTLFVTRKRLHMQYPPDPLDKWIARDIQLSPGGDYVDNTAGETLSTGDREEYERCLERFHKRCKLGGKADRLVRIVDRYMPRIAEENRIFVMRFPDKVEKMLRRARGIRRKIRARRRQQQGEAATPPKDEPPEALRPANMGEDAERYHDGSFVEDTPPYWGDSHEDLDMAETQGNDQQRRKPTRRQTHGRGVQRGDLQTQEEVKECLQKGPTRAPQPTGETPAAQRGHPVTLLPSQRWHEVRQVQAHMAQFSRHRAWQTRGPQ